MSSIHHCTIDSGGYVSGVNKTIEKDFDAVLSDLRILAGRAGAINSRINNVADRLLGERPLAGMSGGITAAPDAPPSFLQSLHTIVDDLRAEMSRAEGGIERLQAAI